MKILSIETSCDETAVTILEAEGALPDVTFSVLGDALYSQASKHAQYGGVFPALAKREHASNLVPLLDTALTQAGERSVQVHTLSAEVTTFLQTLLVREEELHEALVTYLAHVSKPNIDAIAVTYGPGLEPALWVGINFARALAHVWDIPIIPVNHLEGHLVASALTRNTETHRTYQMKPVEFPALCLVISGGHTELIFAHSWGSYEIVGMTRDDSVGEAFDKVARLLDIPYPGGQGLSQLAEKYRRAHVTRTISPGVTKHTLPRPMLRTNDLDFSFSGLKTAVLYWVRDLGTLTDDMRGQIATEFEDAVIDVLLAKATRAFETFPTKSLLLGGGVSANTYLRNRLTHHIAERGIDTPLHLPAEGLSTDNAIMIGMAGYLVHLRGTPTLEGKDELRAQGNLRIGDIHNKAL
jgi:N6-L-threonylcarbamoyladenine synthase